MPSKAKSASPRKLAESATKARPITKRPHRTAAVAAVKAVTQNLLSQRHIPSSHIASLESSQLPTPETPLSNERIKVLELSNKAVIDSLNEVKERFEEFQTMMCTALADLKTGTSNTGI